MAGLRILRAGLVAGCAVLAVACADKSAPEIAALPAPPTVADRDTFHVVVQPGQSLDAIALAFRVPKREIIAANHLASPYLVKAGTTLLIPVSQARAVAKTKPTPKSALSAEASIKPVQTARVAAPARSAQPKAPKPETIPLD
jgi:LysM repeat protein